MELSALPALNATLNATAATLLVAARIQIQRGREQAHRRLMTSAFAVSSLFLALYLLHKWSRGFENTSFNAEGAAKLAYLLLLFSHVVLATTIPVLAIVLIRLGLRGERERHRRIARWAWPAWMYVSVTGVVIYLLLYHWNPAPLA